MKAQKDKVVAVSYELEVEGKIVDKAGAEAPLDYIHGTGMLLPKFEAAIEGKEPGESFEFVLSPTEGYGEYNPKYKFDMPKDSFEIDGQLRDDLLVVGRIIPMKNSSDQIVQGTVAAVKDNTVTMDFNHPMAGKTLHFTGKVEIVRDATDKELSEGLHGEYMPQDECGCGCGHKHDSCDCGKDNCDCGKDGCDCGKDGCNCDKNGCDCGKDGCNCDKDGCDCGKDSCDCGKEGWDGGKDSCDCGKDGCDCGKDGCNCDKDGCDCGKDNCNCDKDGCKCGK